MSYREAPKEKVLRDISSVLNHIDCAESNSDISYVAWELIYEALTKLKETIENSVQDIIRVNP